jgi:uncharacterized protein DUF5916
MRAARLARAAYFLFALTCVAPVSAQQSGPSASHLDVPFSYDGPAPPELPSTMVRDEEGKTTVRAIRVTTPLKIDGLLDEALYSSVTPITDFVQTEPGQGTPATAKTEVWIAFDDANVYVGIRAWDSDAGRMVVNEMRRDSNQVWNNEHVGIAFDTFYDRRNSVNFYLNPLGGRADGQVSNEGNYNGDWNPVWAFNARRNAQGWTGEIAIPFKSIRYRPGRQQVWGVQMRRTNRLKNEMSYLTRLPAGVGLNGMFRLSMAATLVGIEAPGGSRPIDLKPYVTSNVTSDRTAAPHVNNRVGKDFGFDAKYAVTQGLVSDFTYNTDFAQVEADEQQVNLTRFSLFFPEKRDFFLENAGIFSFGGAGNNTNGTSDTPMLFYSRRIGLDQGREIPIEAGGRLTGRAGRYTLGVINMQTGSESRLGVPSTNFAVARLRRDILRRSTVGVLATHRSNVSGGAGSGDTLGLDGTFAFFDYLTINTYWAKTKNPGISSDDTSYRGQFNYNGDRYGLQGERMVIGDDFRPEVGFVRRGGIRKSRFQGRFSPRPRRRFKAVRKFTYQANVDYFANAAGQKESRELAGEVHIDFQNSDRIELNVFDNFELLPAAFPIAKGVTVPAGGYNLRTYHAEMQMGQQRIAAGTAFAEFGPFYGGDRASFGYNSGRIKINPHLALEPRIQIDRVRLPYGEFTNKLFGSRVTYTMTPTMFVSSLVQYNSSTSSLSSNVRFRWEYLPGSEVFVVYNEGRDTTMHGYPDLQNRALIVKANRLLRF